VLKSDAFKRYDSTSFKSYSPTVAWSADRISAKFLRITRLAPRKYDKPGEVSTRSATSRYSRR
jgi:hypothetical protein